MYSSKLHQRLVLQAFCDELQKTSGLEKTANPATWLLKGLRFAAKTSPGKLLRHAPAAALKKPSLMQRASGEAYRNTRLLFKNPKQLLKEQLFSARHRTVAAKKIKNGQYKTVFGKKYKVKGYNRKGQAVIKRNPLGMATLGFGTTGLGMGGLELATNKTDQYGRSQSMGKRLMGAGTQAALWGLAPQLTMGYYGAQLAHNIVRNARKPKPQLLTSQNIQSTYPRNLQ